MKKYKIPIIFSLMGISGVAYSLYEAFYSSEKIIMRVRSISLCGFILAVFGIVGIFYPKIVTPQPNKLSKEIWKSFSNTEKILSISCAIFGLIGGFIFMLYIESVLHSRGYR